MFLIELLCHYRATAEHRSPARCRLLPPCHYRCYRPKHEGEDIHFFSSFRQSCVASEWIKPWGGLHCHLKLKWKPCWGQCGSWHHAPVEGERETHCLLLWLMSVFQWTAMDSIERRRSVYTELVSPLSLSMSFSSSAHLSLFL